MILHILGTINPNTTIGFLWHQVFCHLTKNLLCLWQCLTDTKNLPPAMANLLIFDSACLNSRMYVPMVSLQELSVSYSPSPQGYMAVLDLPDLNLHLRIIPDSTYFHAMWTSLGSPSTIHLKNLCDIVISWNWIIHWAIHSF